MMTAAGLRTFANLPEKVTDEKINPHLEGAKRFVEKRAGRPITGTEEDAGYIEAVYCMAMYYLLPVINTLYLDGASTFARDCSGMTDYVFNSPEQVEMLRNQWRNRAETVLADLATAEGQNNVMVEVI